MILYKDCVAMVTSIYKWLFFELWQGRRRGREELPLGLFSMMATQRKTTFIDFAQGTYLCPYKHLIFVSFIITKPIIFIRISHYIL